jgi:hypothetical protein
MVQGTSIRTFWEGGEVEPRGLLPKNILFYLFLFLFFYSRHSISFSRLATITSPFSCLSHRPPPPQTWHPCPPAPRCTLFVHVARCPPPKPLLFTLHTILFVAPGTATGVTTAVQGSFVLCLFAGPPQSPLHTCTTTSLTLLSLFFCVQLSGR